MTLIRSAPLTPPLIPLRPRDYAWRLPEIRAGVTSRRCYQSPVYQVALPRSKYVHASPRRPSMALLSLCIKPLSPFASPGLSAIRGVSSSFTISSPPFHRGFNPFFGPLVADRGVSLARSLAREHFRQDVSQNLYRPPGAGQRGWDRREKRRGRAHRGSGRWWRRPGWFSRRVSPVTFHYRLITSEYSFRVSPCLLANP